MMPAGFVTTLRRHHAGFARARNGTTAVEFALVLLPFLMLLGAIFEASLLTLSQQTLSNNLDRAGRAVFTGAFQEGYDGTDAATRFRTALCSGPALFNCADVKVEVTTAKTFATISVSDPYDAGAKALSASFGARFQCPAGNDVVTIRAAVVVPRFFTILDLSPRKIGASGQLIVATAVFRAEPYATGRC
ncbi:TadE/TadG family type IV pilus assembly protein [Methylobacterium sp. J-090]|uniref:TadE/TadG family type IV pilus assembly protein n=1 Tax=Methylobacterium sp. J-090 TaxID=2836666 RepID=UPI001FBB24A7|nr:TadE/TadG family type IV pilus assembly protein [Methylobacterium sp. J-090]MCJ2083873.1 pilus assembly protein [Methylobacterium sp. J-090]